MKLSENFWLGEFTLTAGVRVDPTPQQLFCLKKLVQNLLQPIRSEFGPVWITSGIRNLSSYEALVKQGYPASRSSDHFAWSVANPIGTGAADFFVESNIIDVYTWAKGALDPKIGQLIYYPEMSVIHISNAFNEIFQMESPKDKNKKYLIYKNNHFVPFTWRSYE